MKHVFAFRGVETRDSIRIISLILRYEYEVIVFLLSSEGMKG